MTHRPKDEAELIELVRSIDMTAPRALHETVEAMTAAHARGAVRHGRLRLSRLPSAAVGLAVAAAVALALVLVLTSGSSQSMLQDAAASAFRPATLPAPARSATNQRRLAASVGGVSFPYWKDALGWVATGARRELVKGRASTTVFYASASGQKIGYTIVGGTPPPHLRGGREILRAGTEYHLITFNGRHVVAWLVRGVCCVLAGAHTSYMTLVHLARLTTV